MGCVETVQKADMMPSVGSKVNAIELPFTNGVSEANVKTVERRRNEVIKDKKQPIQKAQYSGTSQLRGNRLQ